MVFSRILSSYSAISSPPCSPPWSHYTAAPQQTAHSVTENGTPRKKTTHTVSAGVSHCQAKKEHHDSKKKTGTKTNRKRFPSHHPEALLNERGTNLPSEGPVTHHATSASDDSTSGISVSFKSTTSSKSKKGVRFASSTRGGDGILESLHPLSFHHHHQDGRSQALTLDNCHREFQYPQYPCATVGQMPCVAEGGAEEEEPLEMSDCMSRRLHSDYMMNYVGYNLPMPFAPAGWAGPSYGPADAHRSLVLHGAPYYHHQHGGAVVY